jgi:hypothetical protein
MSAEKETVKPVIFSFEDSARVLGSISPWTLRKHAQRGNIRVVRSGSGYSLMNKSSIGFAVRVFPA